MTTITLNSRDLRHVRALALLADRGQWIRSARLADGRQAMAIPSQRKPGQYHLVALDGSHCSCEDYARRGGQPCKHCTAVRLDSIVQEPPQPPSIVIDGLSDLVAQRARRYTEIYGTDQ